MPAQRLKVKGMTCAACVRRVERALQQVPGVQSATVNLATETAEVEVLQPVPAEALVAAVRQAGYEAELITSEATPVSEEATSALQTRLLVSLLLTVPIVVLSMLPQPLPAQGWMLLALTTPVQFGVALPLYRAAFGALRHGTANMEVLILLGTLAAFGYSLALTLQGHHQHVYYETSAVIITLVLLGRTLEARARRQAQRALQSLWQLLPRETLRWNGATYEPVSVSQVAVGDRLLVRTGERIPVDGIVVEGRGWVDESALTGESLPQERAEGDRVLGGSLLVDGLLHIQTLAVGAETMLVQVAQAVADAQARKAAIQRLADRVAALFVPAVVAIALLTFVGWLIATRAVATALVPAVSVLVIACPCALGLAVPIAMLTGATRAARAGVLIRGFEALEGVRHIDTLVLDKTGTLTLGQPRLKHIHTEGISEGDALRLAAGLEQAVRHPLAEAILAAARERGISPAPIEAVEVVAGGGVKGRAAIETLGHVAVAIGSARFLQTLGIPTEKARHTPVLLSVGERIVAGFEFADVPLPEVPAMLRALREAGLRVVLCSGDRPEAVAAFAQQVGIDEWYGAQLPTDKVALVRRLKAEGRRVAFVGDGINDAPALAEANLGIAVATSTQLTAEHADLVLLNRDLRTLLHALQIARAIYRVIRQNLFFAFLYNTLGIPLAALGYLNPMIAALAMSLSSLSVVGNALRLLRDKV
ncbi:MAG: cation-translocating P-type ATPase [Fimbriimonadales bacterium]|nr:cation-translocating P-type ATPase [Fimbriimonadales bacterium]MDW8052341.1 cation-translocating P-type ATPase [Armatimonadota bacterium]